MERRGTAARRTTPVACARAGAPPRHTAALARLGMFALTEGMFVRTERDAQAVMDEATRLVAEVLGVGLGAVTEVAPSGDRYIWRAWVGYRSQPAPALPRHVAGLADYTLATMTPVVVDDFSRETRFHCPPMIDEGIVSGLSVVIRLPGRAEVVYGTLIAGSHEPHTFTHEDVGFMEAVSRVIGAAIDRQRVEEQLRESEERFDLLGAAMGCDGALVPLGPHGSISGWNAPAQLLFGWHPEAVIGKHFSGLAAAEDAIRGRADELLQTAVRDGFVEGDAWLARSDGSRFRATVRLFALRGEGEALRGFALGARDVTARFEADAERERLLAEDRASARRAGGRDRSVSGGRHRQQRRRPVLCARRHGEQAIRGTLGPSMPDGGISRRLRQRITLPGTPTAGGWKDHDYGGSRALGGECVRQELLFERGDGTRCPVLDIAVPLRDRSGHVVGSIGAFYDISAEKATAQERELLLEETRRAVRVRDDVLAVVSHDLRNHLGVVVFAAAQLAAHANAAAPATVGALAGQIRRAASGMGQLISDLLDVARIETGRLSLDATDQDAAEVVAAATDLFTGLAAEQGIALRASLGELSGVRIRCDRGRIVQVLSNLIGNAVKLVPPRRGIEVGGRLREEDVVVFVRDEGPGLLPANLPHVFDRYWQAERKDAKRGIGLGLAIVKGLVEAHGGRVWVESPLGQGATFSFSLPRVAGT